MLVARVVMILIDMISPNDAHVYSTVIVLRRTDMNTVISALVTRGTSML